VLQRELECTLDVATNPPAYSEEFKHIRKNSIESSHCLSTLVASSPPTNQFLVGALMEKGITCRGCGQAHVQKYWHQLVAKIEKKKDSTQWLY
jgi:hypothetical protein